MTEPIECHTFDPSSLDMLRSVADDVWIKIAPDFEHLPPSTMQTARERLARVVFAYALLGLRDPLVLRGMALGAMKAGVET